ncbi:hypothetical protein C0966_16260 [Bacillus methanolicus]|uniref:NAD(P)H-dependent flavin oxidoreductase n=1 Tax=Bacillus methanolicus TaxID=1471 RepID=UPI002A41662C|nr:hypothetical protein [Bacillus methanolicus]
MAWNENQVTKLLNIQYPIFQAPMAGGITTAELISETSNHGGLGIIGAGYMKPEEIRNEILKVRERTSKPFGVNLFVPSLSVDESFFRTAGKGIEKYIYRRNGAL